MPTRSRRSSLMKWEFPRLCRRILPPRSDLRTALLQPFLHGPQRRIVSGTELVRLVRKPFAHSRFGMVCVSLPSVEKRLADTKQTGAVAAEVLAERIIEKCLDWSREMAAC